VSAPTPAAPVPALSLHVGNFRQDPGPWDAMFDKALAAEAAGIDRLMVSDHVVMGENLEEYGKPERGGMKGSVQPTGPDGQWLEPLTVLSMIAGMTQNVRLGTGILVAALRRPIVLAKTLSTLDVLSKGRIDLGIGVGWQKEEYDAAGLSYENRGALLDDTLAILQAAWTTMPTEHHSEFLDFERIYVSPQPLQPGGVPIWVSGTINKRSLRRIGRFGSGWIPWGDDIKDPAAGLSAIKQALDEHGRSMDGFRVQGSLMVRPGDDGSYDFAKAVAGVPQQVEAGITDFSTTIIGLPVEKEAATQVLGDLVSAFRKVSA
jgi:probable F420-dependent oxidoreductase